MSYHKAAQIKLLSYLFMISLCFVIGLFWEEFMIAPPLGISSPGGMSDNGIELNFINAFIGAVFGWVVCKILDTLFGLIKRKVFGI